MYIYIDIVKEFSCEMCGACCRNDWLVTMDEQSYQRNANLFMQAGKGEEFSKIFIPISGKRELGEYAYIVKKVSGGCWFLGEDNLCNLQAETDHNHLDAVCQTFPRYPMNTSRGMELTLSFSCPAVIKIASRILPLEIIRSQEAPMHINPNSEVVHVYPEQRPVYHPLRYYFEIEHHIIDILQCRKMTVGERIEFVNNTIEKISGLQQENTFSQKLNRIIDDNYVYLDSQEIAIEPIDCCTPDILTENFFINFVFKKPFYLYGLQGGRQLLGVLWQHIKDVRKHALHIAGDMQRTQRAIIELEFQYSHNRRKLLK